MIANCFIKIVSFCVLSFLVCIIAVIVSYFLQSPEIATSLFHSYIFKFNGVMIVGFGYGLLSFIRTNGEQAFNSIFNIIEIPEEEKLVLLRYYKWVSHGRRKHIISVIVTLIGGTILWNCGYPLIGFAKYFLAVTSISLFYVAGLMSGYFISAILIFRKLDEISLQVKIKDSASPYEIENLNLSFLICTTVGVLALYIAFRGTITANFIYAGSSFIFYKLLVYPIIAFLPGILFISFYYRYVLRKIQENEIIQKVNLLEALAKSEVNDQVSTKEKLEIEKLTIEIKEKLMADQRKIPLLSLKDSPALIISLIFLLQFIFINDGTLKQFLRALFL